MGIARPASTLPLATRVLIAAGAVVCGAAGDRVRAADPVGADDAFAAAGIFAATAPRADACEPGVTALPLELHRGDRICLVGNTLFERAQWFGEVSAVIHAGFPDHELVIRNLAWSADEVGLAPRPDNFADLEQHLVRFEADVILAAYGFNESFAGPEGVPDFRRRLASFLRGLAGKAFNGRGPARVVLVSPIANENVAGVAAADRNNAAIALYATAMRDVAAAEGVAFVDVFGPSAAFLADPGTDRTINGCHLSADGYRAFADVLFGALFGTEPPAVDGRMRDACVDLDRQFFRRYRAPVARVHEPAIPVGRERRRDFGDRAAEASRLLHVGHGGERSRLHPEDLWQGLGGHADPEAARTPA